MKKIIRYKDKHKNEIEINLETGDVNPVTPDVWPASKENQFVKCVSLVEQIVEQQKNLVDETTITGISYALAYFGERGENLFKQVCLFQTEFSTDAITDTWRKAIRKSTFRSPRKFIQLCQAKGLEIKLDEDEGWEYKIKEPGRFPTPITDELTEQDVRQIEEYWFIERDNCLYFADWDSEKRICTLVRKSNFTLRILFHISHKKNAKRVIEVRNNRGRKVTADIETKQLTSFAAFKELSEGFGNFLFEGTQMDLNRLKNKLFDQELPSIQIDMLGWNKRGNFFAFSNGIYNCKFHKADEYGIVTLENKNYFIPYHPNTDEGSNVNEKLFHFQQLWPEHSADNARQLFEKWSSLYCQSFGDAGKVALLFGIATLFSDHIFLVRRNFPMLFLYGEGGSGKSRVGTYLQYLWGEPQPPLKLSDRANTDKARIRKMAQYVNAMALFEEFINELDMNLIKTITGIYDRFGYERSNLNSSFGTETVPINSTAFITGNSYPNDDPLMQRLILIDYNTNIRSAEVVKAYDKLTELNREGLTEITGWLLQFRQVFIDKYEAEFRVKLTEFKAVLADQKITVPDRMVENYSMILTTFYLLKPLIKLPFTLSHLINFMLKTIQAQSEKRDTGSVTQRFWDIFLSLANEAGPGGKPVIRYMKDYTLDGNKLGIRWTEIHSLYLEKHSRIYRTPGLGKSTMLQKLKDANLIHPDSTNKQWLDGRTCHTQQFNYDMLNIDLLTVINYWQSQEHRYASSSGETDENAEQKVRNVRKGKDAGFFD